MPTLTVSTTQKKSNMECLGNINKDITTDPNHIRVNYKGVFLGTGVIKALGIAEGDYIEFMTDKSGYLWLRKGNPNYGYRLKAVNKRLYTNNKHLAYEIALTAFARPDDLYEGKMFSPFVLLTTEPTRDPDGVMGVEVFTSRIFRTRKYYDKIEKQ